MRCTNPLLAYKTSEGKIVWDEKAGVDVVGGELQLPCGKCMGCRLERARQWAMRCVHESKMHEENCFITLTYDDAHLPANGGLHYPDFQRFMKRLRKRFGRVRFFMCGEYGEGLLRPHYHACLFGMNFPDLKYWKTSDGGYRLYRSAELERVWPFGHSSVGNVSFESAGYCARYVCEKIDVNELSKAEILSRHFAKYGVVDLESGEVIFNPPEFGRMSLKPGIGATFYKKFFSDMYPHGKAVANGHESKTPRYYDKLFAEEFPLEFDNMAFRRFLVSSSRAADNTPERLKVEDKVTRAAIRHFSRESL